MEGAIKIAVIGDEHVGKTSLIIAAATESFPERPPPVLPPTRLPPDTIPETMPITVTDTSARPEDRSALEQACAQADVVVLVFECGELCTFKPVVPLRLCVLTLLIIYLTSRQQRHPPQGRQLLDARATAARHHSPHYTVRLQVGPGSRVQPAAAGARCSEQQSYNRLAMPRQSLVLPLL